MAKKDTEITWQLVSIDKAVIKVNADNPKIRNVKGFRRLEKITKKYGVIFDGIVNADYSLIDGHSRLELNPTGTGNYFKPSRQLEESEYVELNALFDLASAGDADMFLMEEILSEQQMEEYEIAGQKKSAGEAEEKDIRFPIVPEYDEKLDAIVIVCNRQTDITYLRNLFGMDKNRSYKNKTVGETYVVKAQDVIDLWQKKSK
jgi:hypothetical protein